MKKFLFMIVLFLGFMSFLGLEQAKAAYVKNVDCGSDQEVQDAIAACFKKLDCPAEKKVASGCRNNKQYCGCTKKKKYYHRKRVY